MSKIDFESFVETHREFADMIGLVNSMRKLQTVWSWGASAWTKMNNHCLRFMVRGHHHHGHVYLAVNALDLFDVVLTTNRGRVKERIENVHIDNLVDVIDEKVERIEAYAQ